MLICAGSFLRRRKKKKDYSPLDDWSPELKDNDCGDNKLSTDFELVQDLLFQMDAYKHIGSEEIHPKILKSWLMLSQHVSSIICQWFCESGEDLISGNYKPESLTWCLVKLWRIFVCELLRTCEGTVLFNEIKFII